MEGKTTTEIIKNLSIIVISFTTPLDKDTYDYWKNAIFEKMDLWGNPIQLGPKKIHVYGVYKRLWKRIFLEFTNTHLVAIIPKKIHKKIYQQFSKIKEEIEKGVVQSNRC